MIVPSLDFDHGDEIAMLRETVRHFAKQEIAPRAEKIDRDNLFPADLRKKFGALGLSRRVLGLSLSAALNAPIHPTRFGVFRM